MVSSQKVTPSLSERRANSDIQYLSSSRHSSRPSTSSYSVPPSSMSSFSSNKSCPTTSNNCDAMSIPPTPTEPHWYTMDSARLDEDCECCGPLCMDDSEEYRGLGLGVDDVIRRTAVMNYSSKLHTASISESSKRQIGEQLDSDCQHHRYHLDMPPTPPAQVGERVYSQDDSGEFELDPEAFGSLNFENAKSQSSSVQQHSGRGRRATIFSKVFPQKFKENIMRRMSSSTAASTTQRSPPPPPSSLPPLKIPPYTPPTEEMDFFWPLKNSSLNTLNQPNPFFEFEMPMPEVSPQSRHPLYSPLQSPRYRPTCTTDVFPELAKQTPPNEVVHSPLHAPTISPLMSPCVPTASQTSLNMLPPIRPEEYTVPSIDPTSPKLGRKLSEPIETISQSTITDLVLGMQKDDEAYSYMIERMKSHGWSTPEEIRNLECQREESKQKWQRKINGAKRVLAGLNKCGYPAYQFPDRSTKSMDSVRSDYTNVLGPYILAGPGAQVHRTYSQ
ncbi:hypothetical protein BDZ91DRAFT_845193 [Kalaharituber pfeilii]|nr:hypothetical protein BDZ91DRAFT_845193 [Kalaharituber pfeilii]